MKQLTRQRLASIFLDLYQKHTPKEAIQLFAQLLVAQKRAHDIDLIVNDINRELFARTRHLALTVTTAKTLTPKLIEQLRQFTQENLKAESISLNQTYDPQLIGGLIITSPDYELDASVRRQLQHMETAHA